jgi:hypothetical protein
MRDELVAWITPIKEKNTSRRNLKNQVFNFPPLGGIHVDCTSGNGKTSSATTLHNVRVLIQYILHTLIAQNGPGFNDII